jgi:dipeptidase D
MDMPVDLQQLEPSLLWKHFDEFCKIPRCSGNEQAAADYVVSVAERNGLAYDQDEAGNVVVRKPASAGREASKTVVLQGHLDMVCEKNSDVEHDFTKHPIKVEIQDDWVTARGTTLGADNAIGVAAALAVLEDPGVVHGPIECLCTVDEETGLNGARRLKPDSLSGRTLLNLDSGEDGVFTVGCAGGGDSLVTLPIARKSMPPDATLVVTLSGLRGGHSGIDIDKGGGNAVRLLARLLYQLGKQLPAELVSIDGGSKRNAIPREAKAVIGVPADSVEEAREALDRLFADVRSEYKAVETSIQLTVESHRVSGAALMPESQAQVFGLLLGLPTGVLAMSQEMAGLVETSTNLGVARTEDTAVQLHLSTRSSVNSALYAVRDAIRAVSEMAGAQVEQPPGYPGWTPDLESPLLRTMQEVYERLFGEAAEMKAMHAGLETGVIGDKFPGMDMVSFGAQLENAHSPSERVQISSVARFWRLLTATLEALS